MSERVIWTPQPRQAAFMARFEDEALYGGAAGGGYAQVLPMEKINLHFTGDFHAVTSAHNMISALLDNYIYQNQSQGFALKEIVWKRVLDVNDRSLRSIVTGLGPRANGIVQESGFDITPASEIMAILCLAKDEEDLRRRIENIDEALRRSGKTRADIDYLDILHIKRSGHKGMLADLGLTEDQSIYLEDYGHIGQIDQILSLELALKEGKVKEGSTVCMIAAGIGYTWAANIIQWG